MHVRFDDSSEFERVVRKNFFNSINISLRIHNKSSLAIVGDVAAVPKCGGVDVNYFYGHFLPFRRYHSIPPRVCYYFPVGIFKEINYVFTSYMSYLQEGHLVRLRPTY